MKAAPRVRYRLGGTDTWQEAEIRDLSVEGVRMWAPTALRDNVRITIQIEMLHIAPPFVFSGTVIWGKEEGGGRTYGVRFTEPPPFDLNVLKSYLAPYLTK